MVKVKTIDTLVTSTISIQIERCGFDVLMRVSVAFAWTALTSYLVLVFFRVLLLIANWQETRGKWVKNSHIIFLFFHDSFFDSGLEVFVYLWFISWSHLILTGSWWAVFLSKNCCNFLIEFVPWIFTVALLSLLSLSDTHKALSDLLYNILVSLHRDLHTEKSDPHFFLTRASDHATCIELDKLGPFSFHLKEFWERRFQYEATLRAWNGQDFKISRKRLELSIFTWVQHDLNLLQQDWKGQGHL
jgi:hypothetical protein